MILSCKKKIIQHNAPNPPGGSQIFYLLFSDFSSYGPSLCSHTWGFVSSSPCAVWKCLHTLVHNRLEGPEYKTVHIIYHCVTIPQPRRPKRNSSGIAYQITEQTTRGRISHIKCYLSRKELCFPRHNKLKMDRFRKC